MAKPPRTPETDDLTEDAEGDDHVLEFTPEEDATIEDIAGMVVDMMEDYGMDCDVHFPAFTMEVEHGATAAEIIEGYHDILAHLASQEDGQDE